MNEEVEGGAQLGALMLGIPPVQRLAVTLFMGAQAEQMQQVRWRKASP